MKKEEKKKRGRPSAKKLSKPNDEPDDQPETTMGRASSRAQRASSQAPSAIRSRSPKTNRRSKSVEITAVIPDKNKTIEFWAQQSPNELRKEIRLRKRPNAEFVSMNKDELVEYIRYLMKSNKW